MNATCETITNDFDSMIPALQAGRFDVIIAAMSITDERRQSIAFSDGYFAMAISATRRASRCSMARP